MNEPWKPGELLFDGLAEMGIVANPDAITMASMIYRDHEGATLRAAICANIADDAIRQAVDNAK